MKEESKFVETFRALAELDTKYASLEDVFNNGNKYRKEQGLKPYKKSDIFNDSSFLIYLEYLQEEKNIKLYGVMLLNDNIVITAHVNVLVRIAMLLDPLFAINTITFYLDGVATFDEDFPF